MNAVNAETVNAEIGSLGTDGNHADMKGLWNGSRPHAQFSTTDVCQSVNQPVCQLASQFI